MNRSWSVRKTVVLIFALACLVRIVNLNIPFIEPYNSQTRQSIVATVARNFYQNGFQFFNPEINENGHGPYLYNAEMPFYSYLMAAGYKAAGGTPPWVARAVSVAFSMGGLLFLFLFARRLFDERHALWAVTFAAFSPMAVALGRSIQPESTMMFATVGALYTFLRYTESLRRRYLALSALLLFLAIATKITNAYIFLPIGYLAFKSRGKAVFRDWKAAAYILIGCLPLVWYAAMWHQGQIHDLAYEPYNLMKKHQLSVGKTFLEMFFYGPTLLEVVKILVIHILTPLGAVLFLTGCFKRVRHEGEVLTWVWLVSVVLVLLYLWRGVIQHPYYQFPIVGPAALLIARGTEKTLARLKRNPLAKTMMVLAPVLLIQIGVMAYLYKGLYVIPEARYAITRAGEWVDQQTPGKSLVVASHSGGTPIQLYYCNRKGWLLSMSGRDAKDLVEELEHRKLLGAHYFVTSSMDELHEVPLFEKHLRDNYTVSQETPQYIVFDLKNS